MKILAISGTPHKSIGASTTLLKHVFEGVKKVDSESICENIYLVRKRIGYCKGCGNCLTNGECPQKDDMTGIIEKMFAADAIILSSPTYTFHVSAQMKTFIDRLLQFSHRPQLEGRYGLALAVSAGWGDTETANYLSMFLSGLGITSIGSLHAIANGPGMFRDEENAIEHADRMGQQLARAIKEKWKFPQTVMNNIFPLFLVDMIQRYPSLFREDFKYWEEKGKLK